jgi:hypothetical protein
LVDGDGRPAGSLGSIYILPNAGPQRTGTVIFQVALSNAVSQCSAQVSQAAAQAPPAPQLISQRIIPGVAFQFEIVGATNQTCVIEASADLVNWVPIATNTVSAGGFIFSDALSKPRPARFYRAATSP